MEAMLWRWTWPQSRLAPVDGHSPWDRAKQWLSPQEMSIILVMLRSSTNLGLREVVSEEPHPKHEPQPHANTWIDEKRKWIRGNSGTFFGERLSFVLKGPLRSTSRKTQEVTINCLSAILRLVKYYLTCPAEVRAKEDWLPAHTFLMMNPCRASITLGRYTRLVSPWPSLPASVSHNNNIKPLFQLFCQDLFEILAPEMQNYRL